MAAFSRGCSASLCSASLRRLLGPYPTSSFTPWTRLSSPQLSRPRLIFSPLRQAFSQSTRSYAAKKSAKKVIPKSPTTMTKLAKPPLPPKKPPLPSLPSYQSYATSLALAPTPTLLYTSPSHTLFVTGCYMFGTFCISYAAYNFHAHYLHPPPGLSTWVPIAFGMICFGMTCLGTWLLLGPARLVKSITAVPSKLKKPPSLLIRIEARPFLPLLPARTITVPPSDLTLSRPMTLSVQTQQWKRAAEQEARRMYERDQDHILTAPFRQASRAIGRTLAGLGRVWTRDGFAKLWVEGRGGGPWKVDRAGWIGAVDRVIKTKIP